MKLVRVRVEDSLNAHSTATGTATTTATTEEIESKTREVAHGLLPALPPARHGWRRIKRGDEQVLQIWSRIALAKARLAEAIAIAEGAK